MAKQSHIEKMIKELCPKGVTMCTLEKACANIYAGGTPLTSHPEYYDGDIPWLRSGEIDFNIITSTERNITQLGFEKSSAKKVPAKSVLMAMTGATVAKVAITEIDLTANQSVCALVPSYKLNYRYLYYYLSLQYDALRTTAQGAMTSFNLGIIKEIQIPLPPLKIQEEIVRVLDSIGALINNINEEIKARQRQVELFKEARLNYIKENCEKWYKLVDVCYIPKERIKASELNADNYVGVDNMLQNKRGITPSRFVPTTNAIKYIDGDVLIGNIRPNLRKIWLADRVGGTNGDVVTLRRLDKYKKAILPKYLYYLLSDEAFFIYDIQYARGAKMPRGNKEMIMEYSIPLPPIEEQQAIAAKLDTIEAFIANLNEEQTLRQQQYEYYRAKLISLLK